MSPEIYRTLDGVADAFNPLLTMLALLAPGLGKQRGARGHRLAWRVTQQQRVWPMEKLRERGLHKLLGTIQYPGSKTA